MHSQEFFGNQGKHQNFDPSILSYKFGLIFIFFLKKKNSKWPIQKNWDFQNRQFLKFFCEKFHRLVLGSIKLIDVKGIDMAQQLWLWDCPTWAQKQPKNTKNAFLACFRAYLGQPHDHICWAISINPTNPRTNL